MATNLLEKPIELREATPRDAAAITQLAEIMGYPSTLDQVRENLNRMWNDDRHCILVAAMPGQGVVGWLHVFRHELVACKPFAEIGGLIVNDAFRGRRIGAQLLEAAEYWAKERGSDLLRVRTRAECEKAHQFYYRQGFEHLKTQLVLGKQLDAVA